MESGKIENENSLPVQTLQTDHSVQSVQSENTITNNNESQLTLEKPEIELTLEDVFVNLRLISKIEVGDKLIQTEKYVNIDTSFFKFFTRWYYGTNRNNTMEFINTILNKAFELNNNLLDEKTDESVQTLLRLTTDLKNSVNGLINLKHTYSADKLIQSEIDVMIDNIRAKLDLNSKNLNFNKITNGNLNQTQQIASTVASPAASSSSATTVATIDIAEKQETTAPQTQTKEKLSRLEPVDKSHVKKY